MALGFSGESKEFDFQTFRIINTKQVVFHRVQQEDNIYGKPAVRCGVIIQRGS